MIYAAFVLVFLCGLALGLALSQRVNPRAPDPVIKEYVPVEGYRFLVESGGATRTFGSPHEAALEINGLRANGVSYRYIMDGKIVREG